MAAVETDAGVPVGLPGVRVLHPRRGPHQPSGPPPPRRAGSIRRTTTHDSLRPDGPLGTVIVEASGRDLVTGGAGTARVAATASVTMEVDFVGGRQVRTMTVVPGSPGVERLIGTSVSSGFRQVVREALPEVRSQHPLAFQLLDDLPTAILVSGYAIGAAGVHPPRDPRTGALQHPDLCAGWAVGGTILEEMEVLGHPPLVTGPEAPGLSRSDDPDAWHDPVERLGIHGMRRRRRLDLWREDGRIAFECFLRDSHFGSDVETVVHEYTVGGALDPGTLRFTASQAEVGALPWVECPAAAASAGRIVGESAAGLRALVRTTFVGPSTCTHLNDTLRSLEDLPDLVALLPAQDH